MTVYRLTPLPTAPSRGRLIVPAPVVAATRTALQQFHGPEGRHEGLVYWLGRRAEQDALVLSALMPNSDHGPQHVFIAEREVGRMSRRARALGLVMVAQVHSHPGNDTRHSDGDDQLVLMPHEGMFSLVIACYGAGGVLPSEGAGLHQYQDHRWVMIVRAPTDDLLVAPSFLHTTP